MCVFVFESYNWKRCSAWILHELKEKNYLKVPIKDWHSFSKRWIKYSSPYSLTRTGAELIKASLPRSACKERSCQSFQTVKAVQNTFCCRCKWKQTDARRSHLISLLQFYLQLLGWNIIYVNCQFVLLITVENEAKRGSKCFQHIDWKESKQLKVTNNFHWRHPNGWLEFLQWFFQYLLKQTYNC